MPTPPMPKVRGPKAIKMDAATLLAAAQVVFTRDGLQGASLRAIARQAGCDPALIYYHFENKEAMFSALLTGQMPPVVARLQALAEATQPASTAEKLRTVQAIFHDAFHANAGFRSMIRGEITRGAPGIQDLLVQYLKPAQLAVRSILQHGIDCGQVRPGLDPVFLAFFLVRMELEILDLIPLMAPLMVDRPGTGTGPGEPTARAEQAWFELFWRGIAADPNAPLPTLSPRPEFS